MARAEGWHYFPGSRKGRGGAVSGHFVHRCDLHSGDPTRRTMTDDQKAELRQKKYNATVVYLDRPQADLMIVRVRPDFGRPVHKPGQYSTLGMGYWEPRAPECQAETLTVTQEEQLI